MTPAEFTALASAAIDRQLARGSRLVSGEWGATNDHGPMECGCALALVAQDIGGDEAGRRFLVDAFEADEPEDAPCLTVPPSLGLTHEQMVAFIEGFDGRDRLAHAPALRRWFDVGEEVRERFLDALGGDEDGEIEEDDEPDFDDSMDGDHESALASVYGDDL